MNKKEVLQVLKAFRPITKLLNERLMQETPLMKILKNKRIDENAKLQ